MKRKKKPKHQPSDQGPKNDEEDGMPSMEVIQFMGPQMDRTDDSLESRGILFLDKEINTQTISHIMKKMIALHFNPDFVEPIQLIINSPGGATDAGWALIDVMSWVKNDVRTIALGEVCSMATSIFISGDERIMGNNALAMIHQFSWGRAGNYSDLVAARVAEDLQDEMNVKHLVTNSRYATEADVRKHLLKDTDTWLSPNEMKKHGLCDTVLAGPKNKRKKK